MEDTSRLRVSREYRWKALNEVTIEKGRKRQDTSSLVVGIAETINSLRRRVELLEQTVFREQVPASKEVVRVDFEFAGLTYLKKLESTLDMCLAILDSTFKKDPKHPGFTPDEIESILREFFAVPIVLTTISVSLLRATGTLVTRTKVAGHPVRYRYRILPKGQERIQKKIEELTTTA